MPLAPPNAAGIELYYDTLGDPDAVPLLLVMGLGAQLISWPTEFCEGLVDRGFYVIRFDNRDVGLSTKVESGPFDVMAELSKAMSGEPVTAPYLLSDMADDAMSLLDHLGIESAHIVGASMGGMIAQTIAIEHPPRVRTLTSIMSTTGDPDVGQPTPEALTMLVQPSPTNRDEAIASGVAASRAIGSPAYFDEDEARLRAAESYDRCFYPAGFERQLLAIIASGSRAAGLQGLDVPTLVIHGTADPLVTPSGGVRTAELVPGAELVQIDGMGHDLPTVLWTQVFEAVVAVASKVAA
jgi:pimeloyl-ACP methyl ester carboxylesterase